MNTEMLPHRIRHPALYVWFLGGLLGTGTNLAITLALHNLLNVPPLMSFFWGTLANQLLHHVYYHVVYVNQEIRLRTSLLIQLWLYVIVAAASIALLWIIQHTTGLPFAPAVCVALFILAVLNSLLTRISHFSSAKLAMVEYTEMGETFYDDQTDNTKVNWFRAWFHRERFRQLTKFVTSHYSEGMTIADLGCGNVWWNNAGLPVVGVDVNEKMMAWAKTQNRLASYTITNDLSQTHQPDNAFDIVIMSEVLEHLLDVEKVVAEVKRILKPNGTFLITVPYDFFLGPFFILFNINCLWQGYIRGSKYHRYRCGHVNHFTKGRLKAVLKLEGFELDNIKVVNGMTLYAAAKKA